MTVGFDGAFPAGYEVEVLDAAPDDALVFERRGSVRNGELAVEVSTEGGSRWRGVVRAGAPSVRGAVSGVFSTPAKTGLLLVARGDAVLIDVAEPDHFHIVDTGGPVVAVRPALEPALLLLASPWVITAVDESGVRWQTHRLAIEGVRMDEIEGARLAGVADPDDDESRDYVVDLRTGLHEGGVPFA